MVCVWGGGGSCSTKWLILFTLGASEPQWLIPKPGTSNWDNTPTGPEMVKPASPHFSAEVITDMDTGTSPLTPESPDCCRGGFSYRWQERRPLWSPVAQGKPECHFRLLKTALGTVAHQSWSDLNKMAIQWKGRLDKGQEQGKTEHVSTQHKNENCRTNQEPVSTAANYL